MKPEPLASPLLVPPEPRADAVVAARNGAGAVFKRQPGEALAELIRRATRPGVGFDVVVLLDED